MNEWLLILGTLVLSGFFSGSEIAFVSANKLKLEVVSRRTNLVAKAIDFFKNRPESFLLQHWWEIILSTWSMLL